jgi:hypothetical protein
MRCQADFRELALCLLLLAACRGSARAGGGAAERRVALIATAEVKGTTEPCGCTSDPLGDVARVAHLAEGGLLLDGGSLLGDPEARWSDRLPQAKAKAAALAEIYGKAAVGLGAGDLLSGMDDLGVRPPRQAANVRHFASIAPPRVYEVQGVKVGVFGVVTPQRVTPLQANDPVPAAREGVATLRKSGAQVIVGLFGMNRAEARAVMQAVPDIGFGVIGAEVADGMAEAEPVNGGFLVAPADQARRVAMIELHVIGGKVALKPFAGEAARTLALERADRKIVTLTTQLTAWQHDRTADPAFVKARKDELAALTAERERLRAERPTPPTTSYFTYALVPVKRALPRDPAVAAQLRALDRQIGAENLRAAQSLKAPAPEPGVPTYVGRTACEKCHKTQVAFWKRTVHAQAWKTLVELDKQYNYDCIGCHVTGWQKPGGVAMAQAEKAGLTDVQCEVCHGPGSRHVEEAGMEDPKTMVRRPPDRFCADNCHTKDHSDTFQLEPYLRDVVGPGHGEALARKLGPGVTGHELRQRALAAAKQ